VEIVAETEESLGEIVAKKLSLIMMEAGNYYLTNLKINAEAHIGNSWGEAK